MAPAYSQYQFEQQMEQALTCLRTVLEKAKNPQLLHDVPHQYEDKYAAAEFLTNTALAAVCNALAPVGLGLETLQRLRGWSKGRSVTLRLASHETCVYVREQTREEEHESSIVTEKTTSFFGRPCTSAQKATTKIITKVTEHVWRFEARWQLVAFPGNALEEAVVVAARTGRAELITATKDSSPKPAARSVPSIDFQLTPLLDRLNDALQPTLTIDRSHRDCHTPRRNPQVEDMVTFCTGLWGWAEQALGYLRGQLLFPTQPHCRVDLRALDAAAVFVPVVAAFYDSPLAVPATENPTTPSVDLAVGSGAALTIPVGAASGMSGVLPGAEDLNRYLAEQQRSLAEKLQALAKTFPAGQAEGDGLVTLVEGQLALVLLHLQQVVERYCHGVDYLEDLLRRQLVSAIGRVVTPQDFGRYMEFHYRRLFRNAFQPVPFCYAVRRPQHYPEGTVCLEVEDGEGPARLVPSLCHAFEGEGRAVWFPVDAATNVQVVGDHYVHAYVQHQFSGQKANRLFLAARARQFSSFLVLVGRIPGPDQFDPTYACLLQNKDELRIPLDLEAIPTPKEFRDAIESLSPEQQRFAKAIRAMQLSSTLFGVLVVQVKPQLERLLRLPPDSLTKEIQLTQDLMDLFIRYQVPSDLLTACSEGETVPAASEAVSRVKGHVKAMKEMIDGARKRELEEEAQKRMKKELEDKKAMELQLQMQLDTQLRSVERSEVMDLCAAPVMYKNDMVARRCMPMASVACAAPCAPPPVFASAPGFAAPTALPPPPQPPAPAPSPLPAPPVGSSSSPPPGNATESPPAVQHPEMAESPDGSPEGAGPVADYTRLPALLDERFEALDVDSALRPTIITPGSNWEKRSQAGLLSDMKQSDVGAEEQKALRQQAMDLIDALSRSGTLAMADAQLHVVLAATHCFDQSLLDTVVQRNVNPVERVERSALIMAAAIHASPPAALLKPVQEARVKEHSAILFQ
eukprot:EG_transcript_1286